MIFCSNFITYLSFPSIIIYNRLPYFSDHPHGNDNGSRELKQMYDASMISLVNIGSFYIGVFLGSIYANYGPAIILNCIWVLAVCFELLFSILIMDFSGC